MTYHAPPNAAKTFGGELVDVNVLADGTVQVTVGADGIGVPTLNAAGNNIYISNHGFTNGQLVRYQAISGAAIGGLTSNTDYRVLVKGTHEIQLATLVVVVPGNITFTRDADNGDGFTADTIRRNDGGSWTSLGFVVGQVITIDGTSVNNRTVTIASISGDTLVLTQQNVVANEIVGAVRMYTAPIALSRAAADSRHSITPVTLLPIGGLVDGVTYYVRFISTTSFSLALTPTSGVHTLDASGRTATNHAIGTEGIDLGAAGGAHRLHLDLPRTGIVADAELRGAGGADLLQVLSLKADGQSTARAEGGSGAIISASEPRSKTDAHRQRARLCRLHHQRLDVRRHRYGRDAHDDHRGRGRERQGVVRRQGERLHRCAQRRRPPSWCGARQGHDHAQHVRHHRSPQHRAGRRRCHDRGQGQGMAPGRGDLGRWRCDRSVRR